MLTLVAICLRYGRAVVSEAIENVRGQPGYHCASNWVALEPLALAEVARAPFGGPYVFPCSPGLAAQAVFLSAPIHPASLPVQSSLFGESEAQP